MTRATKKLLLPAAIGSLLVLGGCATPVVMDSHADAASRMMVVARRFDASRQSGGMTGIITEVEGCYASATRPVVQIYARRDCLALDYVGYQYDVTVGRRLFNMATPFYEDAIATTRWTPYAQLAHWQHPCGDLR